MAANERIMVFEMPDERELPIREPAQELEPLDFAGTGPGRGAWEDAHRAANDVRVEYTPPGRARLA